MITIAILVLPIFLFFIFSRRSPEEQENHKHYKHYNGGSKRNSIDIPDNLPTNPWIAEKNSVFMSAKAKQKYLSSDKWSKLRRRVIARDVNCKVCGSIGTEVHHISYDNLGTGEKAEFNDCVLLCSYHHQLQHNHYGYDRTTYYYPLIIKG